MRTFVWSQNSNDHGRYQAPQARQTSPLSAAFHKTEAHCHILIGRFINLCNDYAQWKKKRMVRGQYLKFIHYVELNMDAQKRVTYLFEFSPGSSVKCDPPSAYALNAAWRSDSISERYHSNHNAYPIVYEKLCANSIALALNDKLYIWTHLAWDHSTKWT